MARASPPQIPTNQVIAEPLLWMRTAAELRVTHSWSPNFGFKLVAQAIERAGSAWTPLDLSCLKYLMNAGEQVTAEVCDAFLRATGLFPSVMQPAFGMAEVCTCMTYNNDYGPHSNVHVTRSSLKANELEVLALGAFSEEETLAFMDLGPVSPGVEMRITENGGTHVLRERQVGHLQIRGPSVMRGYYNHPTANAEAFPGVDDGWFDSGDLGFVHGGRLFLTGRAKEMIIIRGANFYCYEIEDIVTQVDGTTASRVAATSTYNERIGTEELLIFFVCDAAVVPEGHVVSLHERGTLRPALRQLVAKVRAHVTTTFSLAPKCVIPLTDERFHRTTSGKIQRGAFKKDFEAGLYNTALEAFGGSGAPSQAAQDCGFGLYTISWPVLPKAAPLRGYLHTTFVSVGRRGMLESCATQAGWSTQCYAAVGRARTTESLALALLLEGSSTAALSRIVFGRLLTLVQHAGTARAELLLLTHGSEVVQTRACPSAACGVAEGGVRGLVGVLRKELGVIEITHADIGSCSRDGGRALLAAQLAVEDDIAVCGAVAHGSRLRLTADPTSPELPPGDLRGPLGLTGGLGGLGMHVAPWLLSLGTKSLILISRSGSAARGVMDGNALFSRYKSALQIVCGDVAQSVDVSAAAALAGQLQGWLHLADVLHPRPTRSLSPMQLAQELEPKAIGAYNLYSCTLRSPLSVCVFTSSVASFGGSSSAAYSSASAYVGTLAWRCTARGVKTAALLLPLLREVGMGAANYGQQLKLPTSPLNAIALSAAQAVSAFPAAFRGLRAVLAPLPIEPSLVRRGLIGAASANVLSELSGGQPHTPKAAICPAPHQALVHPDLLDRVLALVHEFTGGSHSVGLDTPFMDAGVDSMATAEFVGRLSSVAGVTFSPTLIFEYSTPRAVATHVADVSGPTVASGPVESGRQQMQTVALDGLRHRWPGSCSKRSTFSALLEAFGDSISRVPTARWTASEVQLEQPQDAEATECASFGSFIAGADLFANAGFGVSASEAASMDPQQRLLLETGYASLHAVNHRRVSLIGSATSVFLGVERPDWPVLHAHLRAGELSVFAATSDTISVAGGRLSFVLGLHGACVTLDTACSVSITAAHAAAFELRYGSCDMSLVTSVKLHLHCRASLMFATGG